MCIGFTLLDGEGRSGGWVMSLHVQVLPACGVSGDRRSGVETSSLERGAWMGRQT